MIRFIDSELVEEFESKELNPLTKSIVLLMNSYSEYYFEEPLWVTSIYRKNDVGSPHGWWHAIDVDNDNLNLSEKVELEEYINCIFQYDPSRPLKDVCDVHTVKGRGGDHFHIQTREFTMLRRKD